MAVAVAIALASHSAKAGQVVADGTDVALLPGTIIDMGNVSNDAGIGIIATNGGTVDASNASVTSSGAWAPAVMAKGSGSTISFNGGSIQTNGDTGAGSGSDPTRELGAVTAHDQSHIVLTGVDVSATHYVPGGAQVIGVMANGGSTVEMNGGSVEAGQGVAAKTGGNVTLNNVSIEARSRGIYAGQGSVVTMNGGSISMIDSPHEHLGEAVFASRGGTVNVNYANVSTTRDGAFGVLIAADSEANLKHTYVSTSGVGADGIRVGLDRDLLTGGKFTVSDSHIETTGHGAAGIRAVDGATASVANTFIRTTGAQASAIQAADESSIRIASSSIKSIGKDAFGIYTKTGGSVAADGVAIDMTGDNSHGLFLYQGGGAIDFQNGSIITSGKGSHGVSVRDGTAGESDVKISGSSISTAGVASHGIRSELAGAHVSASNTHITTAGERSMGVLATWEGAVELKDSVVGTSGEGSHAIQAAANRYIGSGGHVSAMGTHVETKGNNAHGLSALGTGSAVDIHNGSVRTVGVNSSAYSVENGRITAINTNALAEGVDAWGAQVEGELVVDGGSLVSMNHGAINAAGAATISLGAEAMAAGGNGVLLNVEDELSSVVLEMDGRAYAQGDVIGVDTNGDGIVVANTAVSIANAAHWKGATHGAVDRISLAGGGQWTMTEDSLVGQVSLNDGVILFDSPDATGHKTLTVSGDFDSKGGTLVLNTELGDDSALTDQLHVVGDTSGHANVVVNNVGGVGAQTADGIQVIRVDGASNAEFKLAGRAVGGLYEYFLFKGGKIDPNDGDYYLRSQLPSPPSCDEDPTGEDCQGVDPTDPTDPTDPPAVLRPEVGGFLANQVAATQMFTQRHHDRSATANGRGAWARVTRTQAKYGLVGDQLSVDGASNTLQVGSDVWAWDAGRGQIGVMAGHGTSNSTAASSLTGYEARGKVTGNMMGVYASWAQSPDQEGGLYLDGSLQYARFHNTVRGDALAGESYGSRTGVVSAEVGYGFSLYDSGRSALFVEPQLQLSYRRFDADSLVEANGTLINGNDANGLSSRVGLRVFGHATSDVGGRVQPFMEMNWIHESARNSLSFNHEQLDGALPKNRYEVKAGAEVRLSPRWSGWGDLGVQRGNRDYKEVAGQIGLRANW
nr:autotransporter outer membrane beta-barrel domain-containing protein [Stenotrophomonas maltophilia]